MIKDNLENFIVNLPSLILYSIRNEGGGIFIGNDSFYKLLKELKIEDLSISKIIYMNVCIKKHKINRDFICTIGSDYYMYIKLGSQETKKIEPHTFLELGREDTKKIEPDTFYKTIHNDR